MCPLHWSVKVTSDISKDIQHLSPVWSKAVLFFQVQLFSRYKKLQMEWYILILRKTFLVKYEEREKPTRCNNVYYQLQSQLVLGNIMPIFRRTKTVCYCIWCTALVLLDVVGSSYVVLHSARILQRSAPQPLPTTSSRTNTVHRMQ
jgi:Ni/Fe-hydrogenase subunit HybB-like protein